MVCENRTKCLSKVPNKREEPFLQLTASNTFFDDAYKL